MSRFKEINKFDFTGAVRISNYDIERWKQECAQWCKSYMEVHSKEDWCETSCSSGDTIVLVSCNRYEGQLSYRGYVTTTQYSFNLVEE